jgi:hypothetical protein
VVATVRELLVVNKRRSHRFHTERFGLKKLNEVEGKEKYRAEVSNGFAALEDLGAEEEINGAWETIREDIKISAEESLGCYELRKQKPWVDEGCSELLDQRKQAKLQCQWLRVWNCCHPNTFFIGSIYFSPATCFGHSTILKWEYTIRKNLA